jgi:hypothetical protein
MIFGTCHLQPTSTLITILLWGKPWFDRLSFRTIMICSSDIPCKDLTLLCLGSWNHMPYWIITSHVISTWFLPVNITTTLMVLVILRLVSQYLYLSGAPLPCHLILSTQSQAYVCHKNHLQLFMFYSTNLTSISKSIYIWCFTSSSQI